MPQTVHRNQRIADTRRRVFARLPHPSWGDRERLVGEKPNAELFWAKLGL